MCSVSAASAIVVAAAAGFCCVKHFYTQLIAAHSIIVIMLERVFRFSNSRRVRVCVWFDVCPTDSHSIGGRCFVSFRCEPYAVVVVVVVAAAAITYRTGCVYRKILYTNSDTDTETHDRKNRWRACAWCDILWFSQFLMGYKWARSMFVLSQFVFKFVCGGFVFFSSHIKQFFDYCMNGLFWNGTPKEQPSIKRKTK